MKIFSSSRPLFITGLIVALVVGSFEYWYSNRSGGQPDVKETRKEGSTPIVSNAGKYQPTPKVDTPELPRDPETGADIRLATARNMIQSGNWQQLEAVWRERLSEPNRDVRSAHLVEILQSLAPANSKLALRFVKELERGGVRETLFRQLVRSLPLPDLVHFITSGQLIQDREDHDFLAHEIRARSDSFNEISQVAAQHRQEEIGLFALRAAATRVSNSEELSRLVEIAAQFSTDTTSALRSAVFHLSQLPDKLDLARIAQEEIFPAPVRCEAAKIHGRNLARTSPGQAVEYGISQLGTEAGKEVLEAVYPQWLNDTPKAASVWLDSVQDNQVLKLLIPEMVRYCQSHKLTDEAKAWQAKLNQLLIASPGSALDIQR